MLGRRSTHPVARGHYEKRAEYRADSGEKIETVELAMPDEATAQLAECVLIEVFGRTCDDERPDGTLWNRNHGQFNPATVDVEYLVERGFDRAIAVDLRDRRPRR